MNETLARYTFLPWLRQGIASKISRQDNLGNPLGNDAGPTERASVTVTLQVSRDADVRSEVEVQLVGPGDVVGISPRAIVRTEPGNWVTDFEPNYLAFIEFYDEDFPWRYTPARAVQVNNDAQHTKLRPWIFLMVLEEGEFEQGVSLEGPLPVVRLADPADVFPPRGQAWAWAHVHVNKDITGGDTVAALEELVHQNPDQAFSRLICPRKLRPLSSYYAFLIPAFEVGRLAGLGLPTAGQDALASSWGDGQREYPIYYQWCFRTGERGDFEYLVNLLEPRPVDERVGIRDMDMQAPGFDVPGMSDGPHDARVMGLEGALKSPDTRPQPATWPPADYPEFLTELEEKINLTDKLLNPPESAKGHPDPIVSPPLYGRWHAMQTQLEASGGGWVNELNRDPRYRVPAAFGTQVVQTNQEKYMRRAWQQLGDVLEANQKIRQAQLSIAASHRIYTRYFLPLSFDQKIAITQAVHSRVMGDGATIFHQVINSRLPRAVLNPAFRRITRPRGPIMRRAVPESQGRPTDILTRLNEGKITAAPPRRAPAGQLSLDDFIDEGRLTTDAVDKIEPRPNFVTTEPDPDYDFGNIDQPDDFDSPEAASFRDALFDLHDRLETELPPPEPREPLDFPYIGSRLAGVLNPVYVIPQRVRSFVAIPPTFKYLRPFETIVPVMAHPVFSDPMYKPLRDTSSQLLIPNLDLIPNNTLTLLETNPKFIESYMVGLNHEMARELLWREYPTDQRGSYFRQFWDASEMVNRDGSDKEILEEERRDITPLHTWSRRSKLGTHERRDLPTGERGEARLVLVIKGDLLKKYPTAVIYVQKAKWTDPPTQIRVLDESNPERNLREPIFKAEIEPDLRFLGFNLTVTEALGDPTPPESGPGDPGWFFVIQERPGEPRFGLDILDPEDTLVAPTEWNELTWNHLDNLEDMKCINLSSYFHTTTLEGIEWGANAADMAYILYQVPVMVAVHADEMLYLEGPAI